MSAKFTPAKLRQLLFGSFGRLGFELNRSATPVAEYSGGHARLWTVRCDSGVVSVREETYRQHATRLQLDIGITLDRYLPLFEQVVPSFDAWDYKFRWYPHFQFGWSLGQSDRSFVPYRVRGEPVPADIANTIAYQPEGTPNDDVFLMEGGAKDSWFPDEFERAESELERAIDCIASDALPVMLRCARIGELDIEIFRNRFRLPSHGPCAAAEALGVALCGEVDRGLGLLTEMERQEGKNGRLRSNYAALRRIIETM